MNIYKQMKDAGIQTDHHESDLYVPVNPASTAIVETYEFKQNVRQFISRTDGKLMYDIPFAFQPFWDSKLSKSSR